MSRVASSFKGTSPARELTYYNTFPCTSYVAVGTTVSTVHVRNSEKLKTIDTVDIPCLYIRILIHQQLKCIIELSTYLCLH